jgi:hypothetical protein
MNKISCFIFAVLFLSIISVNAQQIDSTKNSLQKHSWSLQFAIGSDFRLQSFQGLMVSLKYHFTVRSAVRFGIGFSGEQNIGHITNEYVNNSLYNYNNARIYTVCSYLLYFKPKSIINLYFGIGPRFSYSHSYSMQDYTDPNSGRSKSESNAWRAGIQGTFGAEWFPANFISIFAEYLAYGVYGKTKYTNSGNYPDGTPFYESDNTENWEFNGTTAMMGLSVYF